ncbi:MAG: LemA family protein [Bacteroidota bacterium]|nr:LemA family protein [Bacteroidota bacterium]
MKKSTWIILGIVAVIAIWAIAGYNGLVSKDEKVSETFSQLDNTYKRRADLIPNLVETVKKYTDYEGSVLKEVTEARTAAQNVTLDLSNATQEQINAYFKAQEQVGSSLSKLIAVAENYPDLKAIESFKDLQSQLEGTENRIATARKDWIEATKTYNVSTRRFPNSILASLFGFEQKAYFEASETERETPNVGELFGE